MHFQSELASMRLAANSRGRVNITSWLPSISTSLNAPRRDDIRVSVVKFVSTGRLVRQTLPRLSRRRRRSRRHLHTTNRQMQGKEQPLLPLPPHQTGPMVCWTALWRMTARCSGGIWRRSIFGVLIGPGATTLMRIPRDESSAAIARLIECIPPLLAA